MTDLIICWLIAPAGLLLITIGISLLIERVAEISVPWGVRPGLGLAAVVVLGQCGTALSSTAPLTLPIILIAAAIGLLIGYRLPGGWPSGSLVAVAGIVFFVYWAPFLFSGEATWAGYIKLDDTATWLGITDHVFHHGRDLSGLQPSTYWAVLNDYIPGGYPVGSFTPMALMSLITGQDVAWTFQPSMAFAAAALGLLIFELVHPLIRGRGLAAVVAITGSLSSMLIGYAFWGGVKELVAAALLPLGPALAGVASRQGWPRAFFAPLGIAGGSLLAVFGPGGAVWLLPLMLPALIWLVRQQGTWGALRLAVPTAVVILVLALPALITPSGLFNPLASVYTAESELGNLTGPLNPLHISGIWPALDFRFDPRLKPLSLALAVVCLVVAAGAVLACLRMRGGVPFASYAGGGAIGALAVILAGSPWVDGKAMASVSPALLAAALLGIVLLFQRTDFRIEAGVLGGLVIGMTAFGAFLAYQGVWLAPRSDYTELETVADRFDGMGPTLVDEVSVYPARHFLRHLDPEGATDRRVRQIPLTGGRTSGDDQYVDLDEIEAGAFDPYNLIVVRRSPTRSRPLVGFGLAYSGEHYEVWRRLGAPVPGALVEHLPLGGSLDPGGVPNCSDVARLAAEAAAGGRLVAARVAQPVTIHLGQGSRPPSWTAPTPDQISPSGSGTMTAEFSVPAAGPYRLWLGGDVRGKATLRIDGQDAGSERGVLENVGAYEPLAVLNLTAGTHRLELEYAGAGLAPGSGARSFAIGPAILDPPAPGDLGLVTVDPTRFGQLCDRRWDWIEAYRKS